MTLKNNFLIRLYNNSYNYLFKKINNIQIDKEETKDLVKEKIKSLEHSTALHTAWLLNLKRLYNLTKKKLDIKNYHFLDVGCGNGIPLIYAYKKLHFKSYSGFDFVSNYIGISNKNISNSIGDEKENIIIFNADASEYILDDKSYFLFMFNPFDGFIMKKFIENNYNNLVKNKSVIAYSNYNQLDIIKIYTKNIEIIEQYKLAICYF